MTEKQVPEVAESPSVGDSDGIVEHAIDPKMEKQVVRKIDRVVLPLMALVYFFQYLDKQTMTYAAVFGLRSDLSLSGSQYSWAVSLFYFGQLASEYPAIYLMSRLHLVRFVGVCIILWGGVEMAFAGAQDFRGVAALRFVLGFCEGAVSPAFVVLTANFYKRREHPFRVATWITMNGVSQIVGALLMYLLGQAHMALASWRVIFLVCGGATIVSGVAFILLMPIEPNKSWFLNEAERPIALGRLAKDRAGRDRTDFNMAQFREALMDYRTWLFFLMAMCITIPSPILKFSSIVINGFGYSKFETMLVGLPAGGIQIVFTWIGAVGTTYTANKRTFWAIGLSMVPLVGSIVLLTLPAKHTWGIVASTWLSACISDVLSVVLSLVASNVKGNTKKSAVSAIFFIGYCAGAIIGPQLWTEDTAPRYIDGCISSIVSWVVLVGLLLVFYFTAKGSNRSRENQKAEVAADAHSSVEGTADGAVAMEADLTDRKDKAFRYTL